MADDLAVGAHTFAAFTPVMREIDTFKQVSGLGHNEDKTAVISAKPVDLTDEIAACPWPALLVALQHTYLGIEFGRELDLEAIWAPVLARMHARCQRF